ncbi:MAG: GGDEF domain-containing protein [Fibrobacterales bacterium]
MIADTVNIPIEKIMHEHVITADITDSAQVCAEKMTEERVGCIIIMDSEKPVGIITERSFADLVKQGPFDVLGITAKEFMAEPLITIDVSTNYLEAIEIFSIENVKRLPVMANGIIVGLLTLKNMVEYSRLTIDMLDEENRILKNEANLDPLTGLLNKKAIQQFLDKEYARVQGDGSRSSLLFLDIDHFKNINDTHSHLAGDVLLKELAELLKGFCRETDQIGRFGGEEFVIIARNQKKHHSLTFAQRLREVIEDHVFSFKEGEIPLTVSLGVTGLYAGRPVTKSLERADAAMYFAKQNGRNCVGYWEGETLLVQER